MDTIPEPGPRDSDDAGAPREAEHPLRAWRLREGLSLGAAAAAIETTRSVWFAWERGTRKPNSRYMPKLRDFTRGEITADTFYPRMERAA